MENARTARLFLKVLELWASFDIRTDITLTLFWEKLQSYTF